MTYNANNSTILYTEEELNEIVERMLDLDDEAIDELNDLYFANLSNAEAFDLAAAKYNVTYPEYTLYYEVDW